MATSTPWGPSQYQEKICRGINLYSTASHGGYKVSKKLNLQIPEIFRRLDGWYEEDCDQLIVRFFLCHLFEKPGNYLIPVTRDLRRWFPHEMQQWEGQEEKPVDYCFHCRYGNCYTLKSRNKEREEAKR